MPRGDRTGPMGAGPVTGRGAGFCAGYPAPGFANPGPGLGWRRGFGAGGRGWRNWYYATGLPFWARGGYVQPAPEQELTGLKTQADWLRGQLEAITKRIEELEQK